MAGIAAISAVKKRTADALPGRWAVVVRAWRAFGEQERS